MNKIKNGNKIGRLSDILPMHVIQEFENHSYEERKRKLKEANEFLKQRNFRVNR